MSRKEQLLKELKEIKKQEKITSFEKEKQEAFDSGYYIPLKTGTLKYNLYCITDYTFREHSTGVMKASEILGSPDYKKGNKVVLLAIPDFTEKHWFNIPEDGDYYGIEEEVMGIPESEANNYIEIDS